MQTAVASNSLGMCIDGLLAAFLAQGERLLAQYSTPMLEHYRRVAERLDRLAHDEGVLATAGFCHGAWGLVDPDVLGAIAGAEVCSVLHNWAQLKALPFDQLAKAVADDPRAAFLCVYDRLDRVDPEDTFVTNDVEASRRFVVAAHLDGIGDGEAEHFIRHAAATARIAELLGLRTHRNAIDDVALELEKPLLMERTIDFITAGSQTYPQQLTAAIDALLELPPDRSGHRMRCDRAAWRWRRLARVARELETSVPASDPSESLATVASCGFASVVCDSDEIAYQILGRLHARTDHDRKKFFDSVGRQTKDGYRALHTTISIPLQGHAGQVRVQVRIQPRPRDGSPPRPSVGDLLEQNLRASPRRRSGHIRVRTPEGDTYELPENAHVLTFAAALHSELAAHTQGAILNHDRDKIVGVLHRLCDGDRVELVRSEKPCVPPDGWELGLSPETRRQIQRGLRREFADHFRRQGMSWVRRRVAGGGISDAEDSILSSLLEWAVLDVALHKSKKIAETNKLDWILQQLGISESLERGERPPIKSLLTRDEITVIDAKLAGVVGKLQLEYGPTVPEDEALRQRTRAIRFCGECNARDADQRAGLRQQDGTLLVHRRRAPCARGARPLALVDPRFATLNHYFVAETTNRIGIAEEVLGIFRGHDVDVTDIAGRKLGPGWGILRVGVGIIGPSKVGTIGAQLQAIPGVQRVRGPGQGPLPILEDCLPPRAEYMRLMDPPGRPYQVGGEIADDRYFYGRTAELGELDRAYREAEAGPGGVMVFVHGALKTGKSSLVTHFMRRLKTKETDVVAFRYVAGEETWSTVEQSLCQLLMEYVREHARDQKLSAPPELSGNLAQMLGALRRWDRAPRVVLVIDEAVRMLQHMESNLGHGDIDDAEHAMRQFRAKLANLPHVLLVLIGPKAPTLHLSPGLRQFVNSARAIRVDPFSLQDTRALIEARHLQNIFQISAADPVIHKAHEDAAGDPFWIAHLADRMWERANRERHVYFEARHFAEARRHIVSADHIFHDRVEPQPGEHFDAARLWRIATTVAQLCNGTKEAAHTYTTERLLREEIAGAGAPIEADELAKAIDDLVARGAFELHPAAPPEDRKVRIASPLLAENLRAASKKRAAGRHA